MIHCPLIQFWTNSMSILRKTHMNCIKKLSEKVWHKKMPMFKSICKEQRPLSCHSEKYKVKKQLCSLLLPSSIMSERSMWTKALFRLLNLIGMEELWRGFFLESMILLPIGRFMVSTVIGLKWLMLITINFSTLLRRKFIITSHRWGPSFLKTKNKKLKILKNDYSFLWFA